MKKVFSFPRCAIYRTSSSIDIRVRNVLEYFLTENPSGSKLKMDVKLEVARSTEDNSFDLSSVERENVGI